MASPRYLPATLLPVVTALSGCLATPLPASPELTRYDSLPAEQPGQTTAAIETRYGPPQLICDEPRLWIYGWSVGHGALAGAGPQGAAVNRLWYAFHYVVLQLSPEATITQLAHGSETTVFSDFPGTVCMPGNICVSSGWVYRVPYRTADDSFACASGNCSHYVMSSNATVRVNGKLIPCRSPEPPNAQTEPAPGSSPPPAPLRAP